MTTGLSKKEMEFCRYYVKLRNTREAAMLAGYTVLPARAGDKLLAKQGVRNEVVRLSQESELERNETIAGFRRLAFGSVADAVKLVMGEVCDIDRLDLFMVSDIKLPKGGGIEIKFFDRQKALESLVQFENNTTENSTMPFYKALEKSASFITDCGDDTADEQ